MPSSLAAVLTADHTAPPVNRAGLGHRDDSPCVRTKSRSTCFASRGIPGEADHAPSIPLRPIRSPVVDQIDQCLAARTDIVASELIRLAATVRSYDVRKSV